MSDTITIQVLYSCNTCGLKRVSCTVPARLPNEDLMVWMNAMTARLALDHARRQPFCVPLDGKLAEVMIPIDGVQNVGGPPVN